MSARNRITRPRIGRLTSALTGAAALAAVGALTLTATGGTLGLAADAPAVPAPPASPTQANQIQNIDQVRTAIKGYYGDTETDAVDPVDGTKKLHEPSPDSAWSKRTYVVGARVKDYFRSQAQTWAAHPKKRAIILDVDDTSLVTYDYEIYSNFNYVPAVNAAFVNGAVFPGIKATEAVADYARAHDVEVIFLTGRPEAQRDGTVENLSKAGYGTVPTDHLFLKDQTNQSWLSSCSPSCTTIQYKSLTRKHIQDDLGYKIVANVGDQDSDLSGGYANKDYKLPNPMYYLP